MESDSWDEWGAINNKDQLRSTMSNADAFVWCKSDTLFDRLRGKIEATRHLIADDPDPVSTVVESSIFGETQTVYDPNLERNQRLDRALEEINDAEQILIQVLAEV
jgi:hypothetical protein